MIDQEGIKIDAKLIDKNSYIYLVNLGGYVDQANVHLLQNTIDENLNNERYRLIFDLKNLSYMSSAGWGVLIGEIKRFRENRGDIKLINMGPEVYEIYQMLEFYHIIAEYPSLGDAADSFKMNQESNIMGDSSNIKFGLRSPENNESIREKTISAAEENAYQNEQNEGERDFNDPENKDSDIIEKEIEFEPSSSSQELEQFEDKFRNAGYVEFNPLSFERKVDLKILPLPEKIRKIVGDYPQLGIFKIKKTLKHPDYGGVKIGFFKLRSLLKELDLDTKEKRFRFHRSI